MNSFTRANVFYRCLFCIFVTSFVEADLIPLDDIDMGTVDGAGVGIVLEDFIYQAGSKESAGGANFELGGLETTDNKNVVLSISQFYIAGSGSNKGTSIDGRSVNLGRLNNPFNFELRNGNDANVGISNKAVLEFSAPKLHGTTIGSKPTYFVSDTNRNSSTFGEFTSFNENLFSESSTSSRMGERPDMGIRFDLNIIGDSNPTQSLENHIEELSVDGSYIRLWGNGGKTHANLAINAYTPRMSFFACDAGGSNCGKTVDFEDLSLEAELGYGDKQPVTFEVDGSGNFVFEVASIKGLCSNFNSSGGCADSAGITTLNKFYAEGPVANVYIGKVRVGNEDFGSSTISNLQIQYLHVQSHDL